MDINTNIPGSSLEHAASPRQIVRDVGRIVGYGIRDTFIFNDAQAPAVFREESEPFDPQFALSNDSDNTLGGFSRLQVVGIRPDEHRTIAIIPHVKGKHARVLVPDEASADGYRNAAPDELASIKAVTGHARQAKKSQKRR